MKLLLTCTVQYPQAHTAVPMWLGSSYSFPYEPVHVGSVTVPIFPSTFPVPAQPNQSTRHSTFQQYQSKSNLSEQLVEVDSSRSNLENFENRLPPNKDDGPAESCPSDENDIVRAAAPKAKQKVI